MTPKPARQSQLDPAVLAIVTEGQQRQKQRGKSHAQRRQAKRDAERERVTLELDPNLVAMVRDIADAEGISPAGVVNRFLAAAILDYATGDVSFAEVLRTSRSPRYRFVVEFDDELIELARKLKLFLAKGGV